MDEKEAIFEAKNQLDSGNVILFPSDTIWGLSADATNVDAVQKVIDLKGRTEDKSFIVLINSDRMLYNCFKDIPEIVWDLIDLSDRPLTIVLNNGQFVASNVLNKDGSLGIRMVKEENSCYKLLNQFKKPIISTSPNYTGQSTPTTFESIDQGIKDAVHYIFPNQLVKNIRNQSSKVISVGSNGEVKILRK